MTETTHQRSLVMILARDLASILATPVFIVDARGELVYFNEAAEAILGRAFIEKQDMSAEEWSTVFQPVDEQCRPIRFEDLPLGVAITRRVPAHGSLGIMGADGVGRHIEVTAIPLFARAEEFVGGLAVFWERSEGT